MSIRKATNTIENIRKYIHNDKNSNSIFIEKGFSYEIFDKNLSIKDYIKISNKLMFVKTIKKYIKELKER
jgi:hypothetical protein